MVSGFNTDILQDGTIYHVQTEPRKNRGIETTVYVKGAVIHLVNTCHPDLAETSPANEVKLSARLEQQHRQVIAQIRAGELKTTAPAASARRR